MWKAGQHGTGILEQMSFGWFQIISLNLERMTEDKE